MQPGGLLLADDFTLQDAMASFEVHIIRFQGQSHLLKMFQDRRTAL